MYTLFRSGHVRELLFQELPAMLAAFAVAEVFFKFHSFTLECLGFLVVWIVASALLGLGRRWWPSRASS